LIRRWMNTCMAQFSPTRLILLVCLGTCFGGTNVGWGQDDLVSEVSPGAAEALGHPGYLIITAARDSSAGFTWQKGPGPGQLSLTWRSGMLTIPETLELEPFSLNDLAVPVLASFSAAGASGNLEWQEGNYDISEPLMMTDGVVDFLVSKGELEILGTRIRYRAAPEIEDDKADPRASFLMVAGVLLLIGVLMRRARRKMKEKI